MDWKSSLLVWKASSTQDILQQETTLVPVLVMYVLHGSSPTTWESLILEAHTHTSKDRSTKQKVNAAKYTI